jgi:hypothetical protein
MIWGIDPVSLYIIYNFTVTVEMKKYIPASSSEDPKVKPGISIV